MSLFETLHAQLAINTDARRTLVRSITEMKREYYSDRINPDDAIDQITDWEFDLYILNKEAERTLRKMFKADPQKYSETDLSTVQ